MWLFTFRGSEWFIKSSERSEDRRKRLGKLERIGKMPFGTLS